MDTSAFVAGFDPLQSEEPEFTVPQVKNELTEDSWSGIRFKTAVESGKLVVRRPRTQFLQKARTDAALMGDRYLLSDTDMQLLSLALDLQSENRFPVVVTDDYSIQNVANQMHIPFMPLATFGIKRRMQWIRYCPACHKQYSEDTKLRVCEVCGTRLKRKPVRKVEIAQENSKKI